MRGRADYSGEAVSDKAVRRLFHGRRGRTGHGNLGILGTRYARHADRAHDLAVDDDRHAAFKWQDAWHGKQTQIAATLGNTRSRRRTGEVTFASFAARQCVRFISVKGTTRMPAASSPSRTALETPTAVGPSPCTQIESTWQGMRLPDVE